jgi:hypothetical protein
LKTRALADLIPHRRALQRLNESFTLNEGVRVAAAVEA